MIVELVELVGAVLVDPQHFFGGRALVFSRLIQGCSKSSILYSLFARRNDDRRGRPAAEIDRGGGERGRVEGERK